MWVEKEVEEGGREGGEVGGYKKKIKKYKKNRSVSYYVHDTSSIAPSLCPVGKACPGFTCFSLSAVGL